MVGAAVVEDRVVARPAKVAPMVAGYLVVKTAVLMVGTVVMSAVLWEMEVARWAAEVVAVVERETVGSCRCKKALAARTER